MQIKGPVRWSLLVAGALAIFAAVPTAKAATLDDGIANYTARAVAQIDRARDAAARLQQRVAAHDVAGARAAWLESHVDWERSETFTGELYADLDEAIDAWPDAKSGYHLIEARLFGGDPSGIEPAVAALVTSLTEFSKQIRAKGLTAQGLLNGTAKLTLEIGENKAAGGESAASGTSLADMRNNVQGIDDVFTIVFEPALKAKNPELAANARRELTIIEAAVAVPDLKSVDQGTLTKASERLALALKAAAGDLGLEAPSLED
ncbi:MAG TPA: EfeM/EfeO family lipoprotein [Stellaceae bacterium]|nr:EfeM/EfeO family lipoprotein [Stellaceae bacterium]